LEPIGGPTTIPACVQSHVGENFKSKDDQIPPIIPAKLPNTSVPVPNKLPNVRQNTQDGIFKFQIL